MSDPSQGYDAVWSSFAEVRSDAGRDVVAAWAAGRPRSSTVIDVGAGTGWPVTDALIGAGLRVWAVDASANMVAAFAARYPQVPVAREDAVDSALFDRRFDGAVAIGLMFLLGAEAQARLIARVAAALHPGGRFLFSAPWQAGTWADTLTGQPSLSLGRARYRALLTDAGFEAVREQDDTHDTHYYDARRCSQAA